MPNSLRRSNAASRADAAPEDRAAPARDAAQSAPAAATPDEAPAPRRAFGGLFGLKKKQDPTEALPAMDVAAGVSRALRPASAAKPTQDDSAEPSAVREALTAIEAALYAIDRVREIIADAADVAGSAKSAADAGARALLAERYDDVRLSINLALENADERAAPLLGKSQRQIDVRLGGQAHYSVSPRRLDVAAAGLDISPPKEAFASDEEINASLAELDRALTRLDDAAALYCRDAEYLIARAGHALKQDGGVKTARRRAARNPADVASDAGEAPSDAPVDIAPAASADE